MIKKLLLLCFLMSMLVNGYSQRQEVNLNTGWSFRFSHEVNRSAARRVNLPHTWNASDALAGEPDYKRCLGNYEKSIFIGKELKGKRLFLFFEGVNTVANVFINNKHIGEHRGGYGAFVFEITDRVVYGKENHILVRVNNAAQLDIMPLVGDFNMYGGIYRDVKLLITEPLCISPLDYASPGVYLHQREVSHKKASVEAEVVLSAVEDSCQVELILSVGDGNKEVLRKSKTVTIRKTDCQRESLSFEIENPRLWNGVKEPFMYEVMVQLVCNGEVTDCVSQPLGLRYFHTDPEKGFFLNGEHLPLRGVCRHQDRAEVGNALQKKHHEEDVEYIRRMGANAVRLAHYPQAKYVYDLMDKHGLVVWAEIPFVGPGGYADKGFVDQESFKENGRVQLREMIRQHYNHPSICFWGIFNELKEQGDNPVAYIRELNELAHREDSSRITTAASNQQGNINLITDNIAWNRYDGWYGGMPDALARFLDDMHSKKPELCIGISEYGAGASIYHQQDSLVRPVPVSYWHPENWQTFYHMENWKIISSRPFVWGSFVWNLFDFGAAHRTEGDRNGINDKGLITFDRKECKDAFYFYKANWNKSEPMLHLAGKRNVNRVSVEQTFMAFTTEKKAELIVNGKSMGVVNADSYATVKWENIRLKKGKNIIKVICPQNKSLSDECCVWYNPIEKQLNK